MLNPSSCIINQEALKWMHVYVWMSMCVFEHRGEHLNNFWTDARVHMKLTRHLTNIMVNQSLVDVKGRK